MVLCSYKQNSTPQNKKIKIYISKSTADILNKDAELFEFFKQNGTVNRNAFLNTLIVNYIDRYQLLRNSMTSAIGQETGSDGEAVMKILAGQYVLLVLKLGYFTNTTYGYIKWSRYIKTHKEEELSLF